jgi:hypothetical protein
MEVKMAWYWTLLLVAGAGLLAILLDSFTGISSFLSNTSL